MTYTVAATREMRARFAARFGDALAGQLEFRTINGVAARIIALYSRMYNRTPPDLIQNENDTAPLLTRLWQETNHEYPTESTLKDLRTAITYIKKYVPDRRRAGRAGNRHRQLTRVIPRLPAGVESRAQDGLRRPAMLCDANPARCARCGEGVPGAVSIFLRG